MWNIAFRGEKSTPEDILFFDLQVLFLFLLMDSKYLSRFVTLR